MLIYSSSGGYGNQDVKGLRDLLNTNFPSGSVVKVSLLELLYDYECLLRVIRGEGAIYRHEDGSETRRLKLY